MLRNIAIIAHVDHGKTTLVDALLSQTGTVANTQGERVMDSNDIERERGITILAKTTSIQYKEHRINVVDTPGHADFGGEVERILGMVDGAVLLVDAAEGPMPQTKFVLGKALQLGLKPILVVNKIDRNDARIDEVVNETFDLFDSLGATEEQLDFPILYAVGREGWATTDPKVKGTDCQPLLDLILKHVPAPKGDASLPFQMLVTLIERNAFMGRIVTGRIVSGTIKKNQPLKALDRDGREIEKGKAVEVYGFQGLKKVPVLEAKAGDIVALAGLPNAYVSHTICAPELNTALPALAIDPPTLMMTFGANDSPYAGQDGKKLTTREIGARLLAEAETNVGLIVEPVGESYRVMGRGELHLSVLIETMRREGFELSVSRPETIFREGPNGEKQEPYEDIIVDVDEAFAGAVMEKMGLRRAEMVDMKADHHGKQRLMFVGPSRGMIGYRSEFLTDTRGTGILTRQFKEYGPIKPIPAGRRNGVLVSMATGTTTSYILNELEARGTLFVGNAIAVYDGMIVGENSRIDDLEVNPTHAKKLSNVRAAGKDEALNLAPPRQITLEYALTYIADDELVEVTPANIRLRKKGLDTNSRKRFKREADANG